MFHKVNIIFLKKKAFAVLMFVIEFGEIRSSLKLPSFGRHYRLITESIRSPLLLGQFDAACPENADKFRQKQTSHVSQVFLFIYFLECTQRLLIKQRRRAGNSNQETSKI